MGSPAFYLSDYRPSRARRRSDRLRRWLGYALGCLVAAIVILDILLRANAQPRIDPSDAGQQQSLAGAANAFYLNCAAARSAGAAPIYEGQPGYRPELDRDGDGIACEPYNGR